MSSIITESQLEARLLAVAEQRRQLFLQALLALDAPLAAALHRLPADEWADYPPLAGYPQLQPQLKLLKQADAALCQWQLGLYGLCSDCEAELTPEQLWDDPCRQRCDPCEQKYRKAQHGAWEL
ncbi:transcriptional regulator, TraR/DksA family protein [Zobellella iuensis]|uniref:Transcriptional regulator, TraR/DksA family protein n=1 Tax=Zobellella iuensis TaxID=2803811 RepID=A0ABS1QQG0_9GAMM|nr:transcriptional regulator, TraR/DksA family protein [Zobellella iuensis]MBL1377113.1 transcriptional regulator, TraR/DksA family protein [Zobellella iuensis]